MADPGPTTNMVPMKVATRRAKSGVFESVQTRTMTETPIPTNTSRNTMVITLGGRLKADPSSTVAVARHETRPEDGADGREVQHNQ